MFRIELGCSVKPCVGTGDLRSRKGSICDAHYNPKQNSMSSIIAFRNGFEGFPDY